MWCIVLNRDERYIIMSRPFTMTELIIVLISGYIGYSLIIELRIRKYKRLKEGKK